MAGPWLRVGGSGGPCSESSTLAAVHQAMAQPCCRSASSHSCNGSQGSIANCIFKSGRLATVMVSDRDRAGLLVQLARGPTPTPGLGLAQCLPVG